MNLRTYAQSYRQNAVQTASPGQLILMLFDGALRFMSNALQGFQSNDLTQRYEAVHVNLIKSQAIIDELQASLDKKAGGVFAQTMFDLYDFMRGQLRLANFRKETAPIKVVVELLGGIRESWAAMLEQQESGAQNAAPTEWVATAA